MRVQLRLALSESNVNDAQEYMSLLTRLGFGIRGHTSKGISFTTEDINLLNSLFRLDIEESDRIEDIQVKFERAHCPVWLRHNVLGVYIPRLK